MKIVFVCTGNTCRSPMAEGYLRSLNIPNIEVCSRGLCADGSPVSINSEAVMRERGIDISAYVSKQFTISDFEADIIICMSESHRAVLSEAGVDRDRVSVLGNGISDPYGGDIHIYRLCRDEIISETDRLVYGGMFTDFTVTPAQYSHIPAMAKLEAECFSEPWSVNALEESFAAGTRFFTALKDSAVIGYIGINAVSDEGYITNIAVTESHRREGVGTLLLDRVFSLARELGLAFVSLEVRASNGTAIALYEKLGFRADGERRDFYRSPRENAIIMTRRFSS